MNGNNLDGKVIESPAGIIRRGFGNLIDVLLLLVVAWLLALLFNTENSLFYDLLEFIYYIITPVLWVGYTVGKRSVGVQINRINGKKVILWTMIKRHLFGTVVLISPFLLGALLLFITTDLSINLLFNGGLVSDEERTLLANNEATIAIYAVISGVGVMVLNLVNIFMVGLRKDHRGIHDFIAGTYVKKTRD